MKNDLLKIKLIGLLICFVLYSTPHGFLHAQQVSMLGQVIAKSNAVLIDSHPVPSGTTIVSGDHIQAAHGPAVLSLVNGGRIELAQNSALSLQGSNESVTISSLSGGARFYFPRSVSLTVLTSKSVIRAHASATPLSGSVMVDDEKVTVKSDKGEYSVEDKDASKTKTVKDGETATVPDNQEPAAKLGSGYLFSVGLGFGDELNRREVSEALREEFRRHSRALTPSIRVEVEQAGSSWRIFDANTCFYVRNEDRTLNVYGCGKKKKAAALAAGGLLGLGKVGTIAVVAGVAAASVAVPVGIAVANDNNQGEDQGNPSPSRGNNNQQ